MVEEAIKSCIPRDIEERRSVAHDKAEVEHRAKVSEMVETVVEDYEPQRNTVDGALWGGRCIPQFDDLIEGFLHGRAYRALRTRGTRYRRLLDSRTP